MTAMRTPRPRLDPGQVAGSSVPPPERYLLVVRHLDAAGTPAPASEAEPRYVFVRWPDWPHPAMLSLAPPHPDEGLALAVASMLRDRLALRLEGEPRLAATRTPARMRHPRLGLEGLGWLRAVALEASGDPSPAGPLAGAAVLTAEAALTALPTEVERVVFRSALDLQ